MIGNLLRNDTTESDISKITTVGTNDTVINQLAASGSNSLTIENNTLSEKLRFRLKLTNGTDNKDSKEIEKELEDDGIGYFHINTLWNEWNSSGVQLPTTNIKNVKIDDATKIPAIYKLANHQYNLMEASNVTDLTASTYSWNSIMNLVYKSMTYLKPMNILYEIDHISATHPINFFYGSSKTTRQNYFMTYSQYTLSFGCVDNNYTSNFKTALEFDAPHNVNLPNMLARNSPGYVHTMLVHNPASDDALTIYPSYGVKMEATGGRSRLAVGVGNTQLLSAVSSNKYLVGYDYNAGLFQPMNSLSSHANSANTVLVNGKLYLSTSSERYKDFAPYEGEINNTKYIYDIELKYYDFIETGPLEKCYGINADSLYKLDKNAVCYEWYTDTEVKTKKWEDYILDTKEEIDYEHGEVDKNGLKKDINDELPLVIKHKMVSGLNHNYLIYSLLNEIKILKNTLSLQSLQHEEDIGIMNDNYATLVKDMNLLAARVSDLEI